MRAVLDAVYKWSGAAAALAIFLIFTLVALQVAARLLDGALLLAGLSAIGFIVPSIAEICGFLLGVASFLALAHTLTVGGHIRVGMLIDRLSLRTRRPLEAVIGIVAALLSAYATWAMAMLTWRSWSFNDVSYGTVPVPLALPQGLMAIGLAILTIALVDVTIRGWRDGAPLRSGEGM